MSDPILVVEDVPNILELLDVTLRFKGYPVITARNGEEALEIVPEQTPALVITDIMMPKMDGYTLAFNLRRNPQTSHIPIIFLSATYVTPEDKDFAMSLGAVRFMEKPVDTEDFLLTVAEVLTNGSDALSPPMDKQQFMDGYGRRLEVKLSHKNAQIVRNERLLKTLPDSLKNSFEEMLEDNYAQRDQIQWELDEIHQRLENSLSDPAA
ncbi:MAG: two-component system response regulator [Anaerolineales bacterium]|jgi:CheY-like chemotaxis protein